jgi:hypothetical protein
MADCTKSLISLSDFDRWFASDFDQWLASVQTAVVHHSPTDGSQHPKSADQPSLMTLYPLQVRGPDQVDDDYGFSLPYEEDLESVDTAEPVCWKKLIQGAGVLAS